MNMIFYDDDDDDDDDEDDDDDDDRGGKNACHFRQYNSLWFLWFIIFITIDNLHLGEQASFKTKYINLRPILFSESIATSIEMEDRKCKT